jgi:hypothetical protein
MHPTKRKGQHVEGSDAERAICGIPARAAIMQQCDRSYLCNNSVIMNAQKTITLHLEPREYEQLEAAAHRKGMAPDVLVRSLIDDALRDDVFNDPERYKQAMYDALEALDRLAEMRQDLPEVDAVQIVREGREELERRSII